MFHIYIENYGGDAYLRQVTYFSRRGERPAAWEASSTADYWGRRLALAEERDFFVKSCQREDQCPVCIAHRTNNFKDIKLATKEVAKKILKSSTHRHPQPKGG